MEEPKEKLIQNFQADVIGKKGIEGSIYKIVASLEQCGAKNTGQSVR